MKPKRLALNDAKICTGKDLANALAKVGLSPAHARAWRADLLKARKSLKPQKDKWSPKLAERQ